jgi:hypothetical protein
MFFRVRCAAKAVLPLVLPLLMAAGAAQADTRVGWVWADQPDVLGTYTPDGSYWYNSNNGQVEITNSATGVSVVNFKKMKSTDATNVLVTEYGDNGYCTIGGWAASDDNETATVLCFDATGTAHNEHFDLVYQSHVGTFGDSSRGTAFLWANQQTASSYTPDTNYQFNSTGGTNTITRGGVGAYTVNIPGLDKVGGHVQVSAYGQLAARCKVSEWEQDVDGTHIGVLCFDKTGTPSDQRFTLVYARSMPIAYESAQHTFGVYGWADKPNATKTYKLSKTYQYNGMTSGKLKGTRDSKGHFHVSIPGSPQYDSSDMLVTAYGPDSSYCNVSDWLPLLVNCFAQGGKATNTAYDVSFQTRH